MAATAMPHDAQRPRHSLTVFGKTVTSSGTGLRRIPTRQTPTPQAPAPEQPPTSPDAAALPPAPTLPSTGCTAALLRHPAPMFRVLVTRADPQLPLQRLRVEGSTP